MYSCSRRSASGLVEALHAAARGGDVASLRALIGQGAIIDAVDAQAACEEMRNYAKRCESMRRDVKRFD
eukprot:4926605-Pleurochrysis_carterae.AAC.2